ncbi:VPDSG-CTERM sorting domain-containing protein [bacterium]|nr:VPDSG-CTERM sorting domain-containing protein [bacterium]
MRGKSISQYVVFTSILTVVCSASAVPVQFDLRDTSATSEIESGTIVRSGITATLTPLVDGGSGSLNQTSSGFGINAVGGGDDTDAIDGDEGAETIAIRFDVDVIWQQFTVSSFGSSDEGRVTIGAFSPVAIGASGSQVFGTNNELVAGNQVLVSYVAGNGFSFDSFTVEPWIRSGTTDSNSVPDGGATIALLGLSFAGFSLLNRHRKQS